MPWVTAGAYAITDGRHHIARLMVHDEPGYVLWLDGKLIHRCFPTSSAAAQYARRHERALPVPTTEQRTESDAL